MTKNDSTAGTDVVGEEAIRIANSRMPHKELIRLLQKQWIERIEFQSIPVGRKRDERCLEYLIGAQAALNAVSPEHNVGMMAFLVSVRGAAALEDWTEEG